ncbi:hypothetical protein BH11PSE8_BH11PSE8_31170 [soil metagenome]
MTDIARAARLAALEPARSPSGGRSMYPTQRVLQ